MSQNMTSRPQPWIAAGLRTRFAKVDGALAKHDAIVSICADGGQGSVALLESA